MTMKTFRLTPAEFEAFCNAELDKCLPGTEEEINARIEAMTVKDYADLFTRVNQSILRCHDLLFEVATFFRGGYDPYVGAEDDPLKLEPVRSEFLKYRSIRDSTCWGRFNGLSSVVTKAKELTQRRLDEAKEAAMNVKVGDHNFRAELSCDVLWSGWECDSTAWVVNDEGLLRLVATNHGSAYFAEPSFLEERIAEYRTAIAESEAMLALLKQNEKV